MWINDTKSKCMFTFPLKNLARKWLNHIEMLPCYPLIFLTWRRFVSAVHADKNDPAKRTSCGQMELVWFLLPTYETFCINDKSNLTINSTYPLTSIQFLIHFEFNFHHSRVIKDVSHTFRGGETNHIVHSTWFFLFKKLVLVKRLWNY